MDLMNLSPVLRDGKITKQDDKRIEIYTPVARASFPRLIKPEAYQGQGAERFTLSLIFNIKNPKADAHVNLNAVVAPALSRVAKQGGLNLKMANPISTGNKLNSDGEPLAGYEDYTAHCTTSKYPKNARSTVPCYNGQGIEIDPEEIVGGYYVRCKLQPYKPKKWKTISLGLVSVQLIAVGEEFGGGEGDPSMDAVEGADDIADTPADGAGEDDIAF